MLPRFGFALNAIHLISHFTSCDALTIEKRAGVVPSTLPGTWTSQGCYVDVGRTLTGGGYDDDNAMTDESCIAYCSSAGYIYAGTEYSSQCYCGNTLAAGSGPAAAGACSMTCTGNATEACGGPNALNLFWSGTTGPQTNPGSGNWTFSGCYAEGTTGRTLPNGVTTTGGSGAMTVDLCTTACLSAGYLLAGMEYAGECWCGNTIQNGGELAPDGLSGCDMLCNGNYSEYCGGSNRLDIYDYKMEVSLPPWTTTSSSLSSTTKASSSSSSTKSSSSSSTTKASSSGSSTKSSSSSSTTKASSSSSSTKSSSLSSTTKASSSSSSTKSSSSSSTTKASSSSSSTKSSSSSSTTKASSSSSSKMPLSTSSSTKASSTGTSTKSSSASSTTKVSSTSSSSVKSSSSSGTSSSLQNTLASTASTSASAVQSLAIKPTVGAYSFQGCYTEATNERALSSASFFDYTAMTLEECAGDCAAYDYFGVEYGGECYCGNSLNAGSVVAALTDCSFVCPGNEYEYCGAGNRLELYLRNSTAVTGTTSASGTGTTTTSSASVSVSTPPSQTGFPTGWTYQGCYVDGTNGRILNTQQPDSQTLTQQSCVQTCAAAGYTIAGMEYSVQCFCGNEIFNGGALAADQSDCNDPCSGNSAEFCGGGSRMTLYSIGSPVVYAPPAIQTTGLPANWVYKGCLQDNIASNEDANEILSTFPYMVWNNASNTPEACITQCQIFGFNAAGLEYGSECFCGDVENILVASAPGTSTDPDATQFYTRSAVPQIVADSECNSVCAGNGSYLCGSGNLMTYYAWDGPEPLYNFNFPTGTEAGEYSLLIGGVVVPLMTSQTVNGKVTFTEKYGTGEPNGTGAYELDLSEINDFSAAWRTMTGLETDVFCSAGLTLPDKAGRQLTVGGWAGQSNFGVRMYTPDGSAGVPGTNEWQEDAGVLSLQVPRWYPSAMVMANGSIMIIGGEIGDNDAEQPNLELLPATGVPDAGTSSGYSNTTVYLEFLDRTQPFNLYPFVCVTPTGIFIAYYNEARILDEVTFETVKTLPNMPGAVNDPTGGRSYQLEGSMVLLPQYSPYDENLGVLICGGSTSGGGYPIDNCVSTQPENDNPVWTIERMPSRRVMPCMAGLPDGTYVIVNGAQHGYAGFGLGGDPNYNAILYDPSKPVNSRMSIMANTTVARLYHSEAIVLLDGRVLISGSDPTGDYDQPTGEWPEEYRVEVFSPPYLLSGLARPTFTIENTDWAYGEEATFTLTSGSTASLQVSMLGSVVSTHGNAMGQRTIFPAVSCAGNTCTITAPPTAYVAPPGWYMLFVLDGPTPSIGQFVRVGKDPGNIGDWPANIAAFAPLPGM